MKMKIQSVADLEAEMRAVARGEKPAPADAAAPSIESAEALLRVLTRDNRELLKTLRDQRPQSVAELAKLTGRAQPNLLRTLAKLEAFGLINFKTVKRRKVPVPTVHRLRLEINPYAMADHIEAEPFALDRGGVHPAVAAEG